jgi:hypothetical protein
LIGQILERYVADARSCDQVGYPESSTRQPESWLILI